ncbi:MAG TPA: hypothetical protein VGP08_04930 [Pyrinomonadaceae bacterium]|nr:hypothetical protein [Pyrinomonadaceae bacterium]
MRHLIAPSLTFFALTLGLLVGHARAQSSDAVKSQTPGGTQTAARTSDVASIDSIIAAVYDVISGPAGQKRDWERMRSLFVPGARLMPTSPVRPAGTAPDAPLKGDEPYATRVLDVDGYIARGGPYLEEHGFFERQSASRVETYGHIAHVWSTYESRHKAEDPKPFARGINSIQLMNDGTRWWIVSIFWEQETPRTQIPSKYLKSVR